MFIAMNRFRIALGREQEFLDMWRRRESYLDEVPGFREFHMLRGAPAEDHTPFISHSVWASRDAFEAWHVRRPSARPMPRWGRPGAFTLGRRDSRDSTS